MQYPAIVYKRGNARTEHADDTPYSNTLAYVITVIDKNPDSLIPAKIAGLSTARHVQSYTYNNLNHDVYNIYY
jgi:hypothetical protein